MVYGHEESDFAIVAVKPANKVAHPALEQSAMGPAAAEPVEPRAETKGNADQQSTCRAQSRVSVSQALDRIRKVAKERKKERFTALFHHISIDLLEEAFYELKENAAPGVDRLRWTDYEADLERKLEDLHERVQRGAYRALPSRRVYIPKPDGRQRPLAVAALEDKIVQRAVVALLARRWRRVLTIAPHLHPAAADLAAWPAATGQRQAWPRGRLPSRHPCPAQEANGAAQSSRAVRRRDGTLIFPNAIAPKV